MIDLSEILHLPELPNHLKAVDQCLNQTTDSSNKQIQETIARIVKAGGKRLRPSLVIACASLNGKPIGLCTIKLATAVELVHLGSLVHDDIIDEADTRWNIPTINAREGSNQALIIGDYLFAAACALAASVGKREANLIATTITKLCEGQYFELSQQFNIHRSEDSYFESISGKTAALISLACVLGGISAGLNDKQEKALSVYGHNFGLSFQLVDDLMDLVSTEKLYGKPVGNDITEGVYTLPVILGLKSSESKAVKKILASKKYDPKLTQLLVQTGAISQTLSKIDGSNRRALASMKTFKGQTCVALQNLPDQYFRWVIDNIVSEPYRTALRS